MRVTRKQARHIGSKLGMDWDVYDLGEFTRGMSVELEHRSVTKGDLKLTGMIALDHLNEFSDYYTRLREVEK